MKRSCNIVFFHLLYSIEFCGRDGIVVISPEGDPVKEFALSYPLSFVKEWIAKDAWG